MSDEATAPHELSISRRINASPEKLYRIWTTRTGEWFAPLPYTTPVVEYDLRPGGRAFVEMQAPDGTRMPHDGVVLEVVPNRRIVVTDAFTPGWVPSGPFMLAIFSFEPDGDGTLYTVRVRHWDAATLKSHEEMGFHIGWGTVVDQLAALAEA